MPIKTKRTKSRLKELAAEIGPVALWVLPAALGAGLLTMAAVRLVSSGVSLSFIFVITLMLLTCGLVAYDILSRRRWESETVERLQALSVSHDRLVREVARNRNDIAILKEGLSEMASAVMSQGKRVQPSATVEARMIETIVQQLGALGAKPRAAINAQHNAQILELEVAPPPTRLAPSSALDEELGPNLAAYSDDTMLKLIREAVRHDGIDIFVQPVVSLPQRKARFFEISARIRAGHGVNLPAHRYIKLAKREQMVPAIDNLLLLRCLQMLRAQKGSNDNTGSRQAVGIPLMINIAAATLHDRSFMNDLVAFLSQNRAMAANIVFELAQDEFDGMDESAQAVVNGLVQLGCRFSLDGVRQRRINIAQLKSRHIRYIKMDGAWLLREGQDKEGFSRIVRLKKQMDAAGIDLIVEKIEKEAMVRELLDYSISYGQGYLFGKPDIHTAYAETRKLA